MHSNANLIPSVFCWVMHERFGRETSATPDGRKAGFPLGDGSGPCQGRERKGPTASLLSSTKWDHAPFIGGVAVTNGSNCGACDRAVYNRAKGRVTMYGRSGGEPARLEELGKKGVKNRLEGDKISFWMNSEQVEVENSRITVDSGGKLKL